MAVTRKRERRSINGTPEKRLFLSIISDYNLQTGLCELIDNALDLWIDNDRKKTLTIDIVLDHERQLISVRDNAGGVKEDQLRLLVAPGASRNRPEQELIGIFGVGGKRAGVALGEHVEIRTRYRNGTSFQLDITNDWLLSEDWELAAFEIPDISPGTTSVDISKLRQTFDRESVELIRTHLGETYEWFISQGCSIRLNGDPIEGVAFDSWAYPPSYLPRCAEFKIKPTDRAGELAVTLEAGLITDRDPEGENYGVYIYCNHRLIVKELRVRDVGYFVTGEAGVPHPDASLCRVIVRLQGGAELMPWNSSKSGISYSHPAFARIRPQLINLVSYFSSLSRRLKTQWDTEVYPYVTGEMTRIDPDEAASARKLVLPKLPRTRRLPRIDELKDHNKKLLDEQPWTLGLVEAMGLVDVITRQKAETKNRAALILLDSNFEIGLKEFIVNRPDLFPPNKYKNNSITSLFMSGRSAVISEVQKHVIFPKKLLGKVQHYYGLRNSLIHERATHQITDYQVNDYRKVIERVLKQLFSLRFPTL
jgi:hypothetical protein